MSLDGSDSIELSIAESAKVPPSFDVYGTGRLEIGPYAVLEEGGAVFLGASGKGHVRLRARSYVKRGAILRTYEGRIEVGRRTISGRNGGGHCSAGGCMDWNPLYSPGRSRYRAPFDPWRPFPSVDQHRSK